MDKKRIMIIDGNSLMYRAFYGLRLLTTSKGIYTNAVYGFTNMLFNLIEEYHPHYIGVAFDLKGPTFRHEVYKDYKGNRTKTPEELLPQFPLVKNLLRAMDIDIYEEEGYEADDILGTFSKIAEDEGNKTYLVTGDRDALQLVSDNTILLLNRRGTTDMQVFSPKEVKEVYGIKPEQVIDQKALMGDSSDNIPGVPGVGVKTSLKLLNQFQTLDGVYSNIDEISGKKLKENLITYKEQAYLSQILSKIIKDVPIDIHLQEASYKIPKTRELRSVLEELEFNSIIGRLNLGEVHRDKEPFIDSSKILTIDSLKEMKDVIKDIPQSKPVSILVDDNYLTLCWDEKQVYSIELFEDMLSGGLHYPDVILGLKPILESQSIEKIMHNSKVIILDALKMGISIKNLYFDTYIAAYLLDPTHTRYDVRFLLHEYLGIYIDNPHSGHVLKLYKELKKRLNTEGMLGLYEDIEHPLIEVLADMEFRGFNINKDILRELDAEFTIIIKNLTTRIYNLAGEEFNINSPKQLGVILFEKLELPVIKRTKTGYSTNIEVLEQLKGKHRIIEEIMEYRQVMKLKSTYVDGLLDVIGDDGRIHSSFNQTITATGRISSTAPNLQNIPIRMEMGRRIRKVFVPSDENYILVDADYSQIELRVLAHISGDPIFIEAFKKGQDIHSRTASEILDIPIHEVTPNQRNDAKAVNFGIVYGISDYGLARNLGISRNKARSYIDSYLGRYPGIKSYMDKVIEEGKEKGYVSTLMGRKRPLPELASRNFHTRSFGERVALNTPIQGTAADIIKKAMNDVYNEMRIRGLKSKLILQVHDELIIDTYKPELDKVKTILRDKMENALELLVPLEVDIGIGTSWYDA